MGGKRMIWGDINAALKGLVTEGVIEAAEHGPAKGRSRQVRFFEAGAPPGHPRTGGGGGRVAGLRFSFIAGALVGVNRLRGAPFGRAGL